MLHLFEASRVGFELFGQIAARFGQVVNLGPQGVQPLSNIVQLGVQPGPAVGFLEQPAENDGHGVVVVGQAGRDGTGELSQALGVDELFSFGG